MDAAWTRRSPEEQSYLRLRAARAGQGSILAGFSHDRAVHQTGHPRPRRDREENKPQDTGAILEIRGRAEIHEIESPGRFLIQERLHREHGGGTAETGADEQL